MKKTLALLLAVVMVASLFAGCGNSNAPAQNTAPAANDTEPAASSPLLRLLPAPTALITQPTLSTPVPAPPLSAPLKAARSAPMCTPASRVRTTPTPSTTP